MIRKAEEMTFETKFNYGDKVKDIITGAEGTVTAFVTYFDKEQPQYRIEYGRNDGGLQIDWIMEHRLTKA